MNAAFAATEYVIGYWIGVVIGAVGVGLVCGLIPLAAGALTQQKRLGIIGFAACVIGSLVLGAILAVPIALVSCVVIVVKWSKKPGSPDHEVTPGSEP